jgi:hypothetical protein
MISLQKKVGGGGYVSLSSQSGTMARGSGVFPPPPQAFHLLPGRVHRLPDDEVGIRTRLWTELLHAARIHFGYVEVALLIDGDAMHAPQAPGEITHAALGIQQVALQVVLEHLVGGAVKGPDGVARADVEQVQARRIGVDFRFVQIFAVVIENLNAVVVAIVHKNDSFRA